MTKYLPLVVFLVVLPVEFRAQQQVSGGDSFPKLDQQLTKRASADFNASEQRSEERRIGPEDLIDIDVFGAPELACTVRVSAAGFVSVPRIGTLPATGKTRAELRRTITDLLRKNDANDPLVSVVVRDADVAPVLVMGAVKKPGIYHINSGTTLAELLVMAQGFGKDASAVPSGDIVVSNGARQPQESVSETERRETQERFRAKRSFASHDNSGAGAPKTVHVSVANLLESSDSRFDVPIDPGTLVRVSQVPTIYVAGEVSHPGRFAIMSFDRVSVVQAISMAGGPLKTANRSTVDIIRRDRVGNRVTETINLARILAGKDPDVMLRPNDILFLPGAGKAISLRAIENAAFTGSGFLIYRH
jgi:polysaccharide export outer membrane protein